MDTIINSLHVHYTEKDNSIRIYHHKEVKSYSIVSIHTELDKRWFNLIS